MDETFLVDYIKRTFPDDGGITIGLIGASRTGKSTLLVQLINHIFNRFITVVMTCSPKAGPFKDLPKNVPIYGFGLNFNFLDKAEEINLKWHEQPYPFLMVIDDVIRLRGTQLEDMILTKRNHNVSTICSTQWAKLLRPSERDSINIMFLTGAHNPEGAKQAIECFLKGWLPYGLDWPEMIGFFLWWTKPNGQVFMIHNLNGEAFAVKDGLLYQIADIFNIYKRQQ